MAEGHLSSPVIARFSRSCAGSFATLPAIQRASSLASGLASMSVSPAESGHQLAHCALDDE
jgi:hypothetical protein